MRYIGKGPVGYYELLSEITAVAKNPAMAGTVWDPAFCPKNGGKIRFPAPKKSANSITLITAMFFFPSFIYFSFLFNTKGN
jgi:hypothetical protein